MATDLNIRIALVGPLREKVLACMRQIRPAMVGELRGLLLDVAQRTTRRASGDVLKVRTGHLRRTIGPPTVQETSGGAMGELSVTAPYAKYLERGTSPYRIVARRGKALRFLVGGQVRFAKAVQHPGLRPRPFFEPSWNETIAGPPSARTRLSLAIQHTVNEA
jgi:hypothetical protein